jgi:UDP-glucuronate 4-epimerase
VSKSKKMVTGAAGFIGFHLCKRLIEEGDEVVGIDNLNDYYDVALKKARLAQLESKKKFKFIKLSLEKKEDILSLFKSEEFDVVVNLAAQAGVRYSLINPYNYLDSNIYGFLNILEGCRHAKVKNLVFA